MSIMVVASALLFAQTGAGQDLISKNVGALAQAKSLNVTFSVERIPAAAEEWKASFAKPNMLRLETPKTTWVTDGKSVWEYTKASNEYCETPGDISTLLGKVKQDELYAWASFFINDQFKNVKDATVGKKLSMKGATVTEVKFTIDASKSKTGSLYIDAAGIARGASIRAARGEMSTETVTKAKEITLGDSADASTYAFNAPAGAKKVEIAAGEMAKWYFDLDEGLKVAKATGRMVFLDFNATWCGPCQMYKREVFPTDEFKAMSKYFVFVDVDVDEQKSLASQYSISAIPDLRFLKADGTEVHKVVGYKGMALLSDFDIARQAGR